MATSLSLYVRDQSFHDPVLEFISRRPVTAINIDSQFFFLLVGNITDVKNVFTYQETMTLEILTMSVSCFHDRKMFQCSHLRSRVC